MADNQTPIEDRVIDRDSEHTVGVEPSPRWVRALLGGVVVADSKRVLLLRESRHLPVYYFPVEDVRMDLLEPSGLRRQAAPIGEQAYYTVRAGGRVSENAAWAFEDPAPVAAALEGHVAFYWNRMDTWYEEDDEVYVHPRDPYHRVDVLNSSRHVRVEMLGQTVADSHRPRLLFETSLPTRYYLPRQDVRMDLLVPSDTTSQCPYKGMATYFSLRAGDTLALDIAWTYEFPIPESPKIENLVCFFNERVDAIYVDGERQPVPQTPWARKAKLVKVEEE